MKKSDYEIQQERQELITNIIWCVKFVSLIILAAAVVRLIMLIKGV